MITQDQVEAAVIYLAESAKEYAQACGRRYYMEEKRKSVKATFFNASQRKTAAERENEAYAHPDYLALLESIREAVEDEVLLRALRAGAEARIEVWRSQESSRRAANV